MSRSSMAPAAGLAAAMGAVAAAASAWVFFHDFPAVLAVVEAAGEQHTATLLSWVYPLISDLGVIGAVLWVVAAVGLWGRKAWAAAVVGAALTLGLMSGFMPVPPTASRGVFPSSALTLLLPVLVVYPSVARRGLRLPWRVVLLGLAVAFATQLSFMNGIASTHRLLDGWGLVYAWAQRIHWLIMAGWMVVQVALHIRRRWVFPLGIGLGLAGLLVGAPVATVDSVTLGRFSLFGLAPLWSLAMLITFLRWHTREHPRIARWLDN